MNVLFLPHKVPDKTIRPRALGFSEGLAQDPDFNVYLLERGTSLIEDYKRAFRLLLTKQGIVTYSDKYLTLVSLPYIPAPWPLKYNQNLLGKLIEKLDIHIVVSEYSHSLALPISKNFLYVYDFVDDYSMFHSFLLKGIINRFVKGEIAKADLVIVGTTTLGERAKTKGWLRDYWWLPSGANLELFEKVSSVNRNDLRRQYNLSGKFVIGHIGYQDRRSGTSFIIDVYKNARRMIQNLALFIVGPGPEVERLKRISQGDPNIVFTGPISRQKVPVYFAASDVGVVPYSDHPSVDTRFPLRLVDFLVAKKIVIAWPFGDMQHLDFPNVILTERTVEAWTKALCIARNLTWQEEWDLLVKRFSWDFIVTQLKTVLKKELLRKGITDE